MIFAHLLEPLISKIGGAGNPRIKPSHRNRTRPIDNAVLIPSVTALKATDAFSVL